MLSLLHLIVAILTILAYFVGRNRLLALARCKKASKPDEEEQEYGSAVVQHGSKMGTKQGQKSFRQTSQSHPDHRSGVVGRLDWGAGMFPRHKTDPRIFVDNEEIGREPMVTMLD